MCGPKNFESISFLIPRNFKSHDEIQINEKKNTKFLFYCQHFVNHDIVTQIKTFLRTNLVINRKVPFLGHNDKAGIFYL